VWRQKEFSVCSHQWCKKNLFGNLILYPMGKTIINSFKFYFFAKLLLIKYISTTVVIWCYEQKLEVTSLSDSARYQELQHVSTKCFPANTL
jgi:hypothetical protein